MFKSKMRLRNSSAWCGYDRLKNTNRPWELHQICNLGAHGTKVNRLDFDVEMSNVRVTARPNLVKTQKHFPGMRGHVSVKVITVTYYRIHVTLSTFWSSWTQRSTRSQTAYILRRHTDRQFAVRDPVVTVSLCFSAYVSATACLAQLYCKINAIGRVSK